MVSMDSILVLRGLGGGLVIGLSAALLLFLNGRVAGISGIVAGLWSRHFRGAAWRLAFVLGLLVGGWFLLQWRPEVFGVPPESRSIALIALAGLLVGFGASLSGGCTSGHGVCGLGRRSLRSLIATLTFMLTGFLTVFVFHLVPGAH